MLRAIAAFADEGRADPSLREIAARAEVDGWEKAEALVRRLEADGFVRMEWARGQRYRRRGWERMPRTGTSCCCGSSGV